MFDWLFGTKRQTNFDDTKSLYDKYNDANSSANDYYNKNIANVDWNSLGRDEQIKRANEFNRLDDQRSALGGQYDRTNQLYDQENKDRKYQYFGNGLIGSLLNPIGQTATAIGDLATGNYKDRDALSDIGAAGETLLTLLPGAGAALKGAKAAGTASKLGKIGSFIERAGNPASIPGMALNGAAQGALSELRENGNQTNFGDVIGGAGSGALFGGGIGAGMKYGGRVLGNVMNNGGLKGAMSRLNGSKLKKAALIGGGLYGGSQLLGMGGGQPQPVGGYGAYGDNSDDELSQLAQAYAQQYGSMPTQDELAQMLQGGYY